MSKFSNIKTGVIGVGVMGNYHSNIYSSLSNLVGVSDANEELGRQIANKYGVKFYSDYEKLMDAVDAVSIAVPTPTATACTIHLPALYCAFGIVNKADVLPLPTFTKLADIVTPPVFH